MVVLSTLRFRFVPWILAGVFLFLLPAIAHAAGDPLGSAQASVDGGISLFATYGPIPGGMYLLYQLVSRLVAKYASSSWFAKGKRLAYATGILGVGGAVLQTQVAGSPWNVIALAGIAAVFKLLTPTVKPATAPTTPTTPTTSSDPNRPTVRLTGISSSRAVSLGATLLVLGIGGSVLAGYGCGPKSTAVLNTALDCTSPPRKDFVDALTPTAVSAIDKIADPSGKITTDALRALFSGASLKSEAGVLVACLEANAINFIAALLPVSQTATSSLSAQTSPRVQVVGSSIDVAALQEALAAQFPGVVFKTSR